MAKYTIPKQHTQIQKTIKRVLEHKVGQFLLKNNKRYLDGLIALLAVQVDTDLNLMNKKNIIKGRIK